MAQSIAVTDTPFNWEGTDSRGKKIRGKSVAASEAAVRAELRRKGVVASKVRKQSTLFQSKGKISPLDIAIFSRQLATMMTAGIPLVQSFDIVGSGHDNPAMQKLIFAIKADVEGGNTLADALARHPLHSHSF
jgi:type IV pilus assembly protein PilC